MPVRVGAKVVVFLLSAVSKNLGFSTGIGLLSVRLLVDIIYIVASCDSSALSFEVMRLVALAQGFDDALEGVVNQR